MKWVHRRSQSILHPFSITIFEDRVYWTDWRNIGVYSANKWTGEDETEVQQVAMHPFGIHVYHPTKQPTGTEHKFVPMSTVKHIQFSLLNV